MYQPEKVEAAKRVIGSRLDDEVLEAFDLLFPERTPELSDSLDDIRYASGQRSVVRFLRSLVEPPN